jgi:hypothetical protein
MRTPIKMSQGVWTTVWLVAILVATPAGAAEPAFCSANSFFAKEVDGPSDGAPKRLHLFKLGQLNLAGMAVGGSSVKNVKALAEDYAEYSSAERYCTWYFNKGNSGAAKAFNWYPLPMPGKDAEATVAKFVEIAGGVFSTNSTNMLNCAESAGYVGFGCDGMMHRGPTMFAMVLSFVGCTPQHSVAIVEKLWGKNGVPTATRIAVAQKGLEMGAADPKARERFLKVMTAE